MKKWILLAAVLISAGIPADFGCPASAQGLFGRFGRKGKGGVEIKLETANYPNAQFSALPSFALRFEDKRSSSAILQKIDGENSLPEVTAEIEPFEFVKDEFARYMTKLGFPCSEYASGGITLVVTLDKFDVGYYSGKGWAANISLGLVLSDGTGEEFYTKEINRDRAQINASSSDYDVMEKALNNAWNSLLSNKIEWRMISVALKKAAEPKSAPAAAGGQIVNITNVINQGAVAQPLSASPVSQPVAATESAPEPQRKLSDVDENIPSSGKNTNSNTFVLIIANENYKDLAKVNFALNDAETFKEYCIKTLGVPEKQIFHFKDATYGEMGKAFGKLEYVLNEFEGKRAIVYYCGHGTNDESTGKAYIVPVDGDAKGSVLSYGMENIYKDLSNTKATSVTYFLDACFSGAGRDGGMLVAARGTARAPKKEVIEGTTVVFSATSNDETAMAYDEKGHGLFTYYLLKALQNSQGDISYGDLYNFLSENVKNDAFLINEKPQHPMVATSPGALDNWKTMKLK